MKRHKYLKPPKNFWNLQRHPKCFRKKQGRYDLQVYAWNIDNSLQVAGVIYSNSVSVSTLYRFMRHHLRWRAWYDNLPWNKPQDYPAKHDKPYSQAMMFPVYSSGPQVRMKLSMLS